ncbi:asparagine synthase-related protein [Candidatus Contubernalis alkaliaceticus]|uniref:asparagine synthase-related protein n=1 Tax=Candidatus Contubernalis alkaliaceticus TaxID=338645 RepID=UPI001F4C4227|nr:asparagine synthase-related protein [Candidatus Contubernalis alkalaceticus]UNC90744.1 7-cyano-7-deazaguanine synthase [Candidatus Contubernalis alkalaceticus]
MAGIAGCVGAEASKKVEQMIQEIKHRGVSEPIIKTVASGCAGSCVGFVGENSLGISGETAPFVMVDGTLIRDDKRQGVSDADYLREKYIQHGKEAFSKISGSFACAVMDENECIIARDHVGARPLIYNESPQSEMFFASEAKALKQFTDHVEELLPGHYFSTKEGQRQFNDCALTLPKWDTPLEAVGIVRELLIQAVEQALSSGNIGGIALSGGLDSSIILAIAHKFDKNLKAFTATLDEHPGEDLQYAKQLTDYLGVEHHIYRITQEDIEAIIPEAVWYLESFDEDCIVGFIANYYTSRLASEHVNGVLVGEGADELFGGYFRELQDISDPAEKERIGRKLLDISYNTALRRLDRGWMSNSIEYYAPFLHPAVVAMSHKIPMELKVYQGEVSVEKWILREAFRDMLPKEIADRPKLRFSRGVGVDDQVDKIVPDNIGEKELKENPKSCGGLSLQSPKELYFYRLFQKHFPKGFECLTGRWDPFK